MMRLLRGFGRGLQNGLVAIGALAFLGTVVAVAANYALTQGSGTTFGSVVVGGVNYAQHFICDATTPSQCAAVGSSGHVAVNIAEGLNSNVTPADNVANTAAAPTWSQNAVWDSGGSQWVRWPGTAAAGAQVNVKSGGIASGAIASGAVASGAIASGAVASGAFASGAIGSGAIASGAVASGAIASGAIASGAFAAGSFANATAADPCMFAAKTNVAISMQNTTTVKLVALASSQKIYICSLSLIASGATVFSIADGTKVSTECDTAAEAVIGAAVASHGLSLAANGGISFGSGNSTIALTNTVSHDLCLFQSGSVDLSGNITYVQRVP